MTRTMYDAVTAANIPPGATLIAGYVDGRYANLPALGQRFPHATIVGIAVRATTNAGQVLDVETGDATPDQAPGWATMRRRAGVDPTIYCNTSTWPAVKAAFAAQKVTPPHWWIAHYDNDPTIPAGAIAKQYRDPGPYDQSSVADYWPGVDPAPQEDPLSAITLQQIHDTAKAAALEALQSPEGQAAIEGASERGVASQPGRDAESYAGLWWLDHALAGTVPAGASPAQRALLASVHQHITELKASPAPTA